MVNVQEWLDKNYPQGECINWRGEKVTTRSEVEEIYLNEPNLEGELNLKDFTYEYLRVQISLSVDEQSIDFFDEGLKTKLTFKNLPEKAKVIKLVDAQEWLDREYPKERGCLRENEAYKLNNLSKKRSEIEKLDIYGQNLEGSLDLSGFSSLKELYCWNNQLTSLNLSNCLQLEEIYFHINNFSSDLTWLTPLVNLKILNIENNNFHGSLEPLKNLTKLEWLNISDTDLNRGVEYLPESLEKIWYYTYYKSDSKVSQVKEQLDEITWQDIHKDFQPKDKKEWIELFGFTKEQTKQLFQEWNKKIELIRPRDAKFLIWYLNTKKLDLEWALENEEEFIHWRDNYQYFGTCKECQQTNTGESWCQFCNAKHFKEEFSNWTSGNPQIDKFIQKCQLEATSAWNVLEWIPYEQFTNIEHIANGGFGKVEKAVWIGGSVRWWDNKENKWGRYGDYDKYDAEKNEDKYKDYKSVALKTLSNSNSFSEEKKSGLHSNNLDKDFLPELVLYKMFKSEATNMVPCYGISQHSETKDYIMVMEFMAGGNLKEYLKRNCKKLKFYDKREKNKLKFLKQIITGLKDIHRKGLVHKDFHSGNIIVDEEEDAARGRKKTTCKITDLGLCKPVNEADDNKVFGVLPYVAPEVLRNQPYTPKADIYSLGMIMYEIITGYPPFYSEEHNTNLVLSICRGIRPQFPPWIKYPQLLIDLIKSCWNSELEQRPTAKEISQIVNDWFYEDGILKTDTPFYQQYEEAEKHNKTLSKEVKYPNYQIKETVWSSKLINTKQITQRLQNSPEIAITENFDSLLIDPQELAGQIEQLPK